ncbi:saccharopine dehydrogenase family protein [Pedobacter sp. AW31-3R]|uniref:saccharopine dehydrogenase family protein n=1 Tax=Pedobacter sp. AW31-3R TaxID=3445781 RepID=UPI003FA00375
MIDLEVTQQGKLLIYGATGYTGTLIVHEAARRGLDFEIAGRNEEKLAALSTELNVPYHVFPVNDLGGWKASLEGKTALLNIAGPFSETAEYAMEAAILFKVHYFDITAEVDIYRLAESKDAAAKAAGIMLLPGAGLFATYDPLVVHTAKRVKNPIAMRAAFKYSGGFTPGSVASSSNIINAGMLVRKNGKIKKLNEAPSATFDLGNGPEDFSLMPLGGVVLSFKSTGIPDIEEYFKLALSAGSNVEGAVKFEEGHPKKELITVRSQILIEITDEDGMVVRSMADMPEGYLPTVTSAVEVVNRALKGSYQIGFQSPASAYGSALMTSLLDVVITDF